MGVGAEYPVAPCGVMLESGCSVLWGGFSFSHSEVPARLLQEVVSQLSGLPYLDPYPQILTLGLPVSVVPVS